MLVYGTANPVGYGDGKYAGMYLTDTEINTITPTMIGTPIKIEHKGGDVGKVVSAWKHDGRMDLLMQLDGDTLDAQFGKEFVRKGMCKDLSLGYGVFLSKSPVGIVTASNKRVAEVSLVKTGARDNCPIRGWEGHGSKGPTAPVKQTTSFKKKPTQPPFRR